MSRTREVLSLCALYRSQFGKPGTPYDFRKADIGQLRNRANELQSQQDGMKRKGKVNAHSVGLQSRSKR